MLSVMPTVDVYIARLPENLPIGEVECKIRREEIASVSNERVKREKYFVWKLLCYALERSFGMREGGLDFVKESYGGWSVGEVSVSLSHSGAALAVAVSHAAVGIDVERIHTPRAAGLAERIMTPEELAEFERIPCEQSTERLIGIWTAKEAIFKSRGLAEFIPNLSDTASKSFKTDSIIIGGEKYAWSVATETPDIIRVFTDVDFMRIK